jgi:DNA-binding transcriptional MerR regulator
MTNREHLLPIGAFAARTRLSIKALRLYDKLGLLTPAEIDADSGYRYYRPEQERRAKLIFLMRRMDMPLATIRSVLDSSDDDAATIAACYQSEQQRHVNAARDILADVLALLRNEEINMEFEVRTKHIPATTIAGITKRVYVKDLETHIHHGIGSLQKHAGDRVIGDFFGIYHGEVNEHQDGPMEVAAPIRGEEQVEGAVVRTLPENEAAVVDVPPDQCHFPAILRAYEAACNWIEENGKRTADSPREIWKCEGHEMQMQIVWPYKD